MQYHSYSVRIMHIIPLGKNLRILTNFIMDMNVWNNYVQYGPISPCKNTGHSTINTQKKFTAVRVKSRVIMPICTSHKSANS